MYGTFSQYSAMHNLTDMQTKFSQYVVQASELVLTDMSSKLKWQAVKDSPQMSKLSYS